MPIDRRLPGRPGNSDSMPPTSGGPNVVPGAAPPPNRDNPYEDSIDNAGIQLSDDIGETIPSDLSDVFGPLRGGDVLPGIGVLPGRPSQDRLPPTEEQFSLAVNQVLARVVQDKDEPDAWLQTENIKRDLRALTAAPEAAFVLSNPEIIGEWQNAIWMGTLDAMASDYPELKDKTYSAESAQMVSGFFKKYGSNFSQKEREALFTILASMPNANEILRDKGQGRVGGGGWWGNFRSGWNLVTGSPEAIQPAVQDPRSQLVAQLSHWLNKNPLESLEDRSKFMMFAASKGQASIESAESESGGFFGLMRQTVGLPFTVAGDLINDFIQGAANPEEFALRQHMSIGQNFAASIGLDPSEGGYASTSGFVDGFSGVVFDPGNLVYGTGSAIRNASRIPRTVPRATALRYAANPFGGSKLGLPVLDRGVINRFAYAALSKDVDQITNTSRAWRHWKWIAQTDSATEILQRFPDLGKNAEALAEIDEPWKVREVVRAGLQGGVALGWDAPLKTSQAQAGLQSAVVNYRNARAQHIANGGSLQALDPAIDVIEQTDVYVPRIMGDMPAKPQVLEVVGDAVNPAVPDDVFRAARRGGILEGPQVLDTGRGVIVRGSKGNYVAVDEETGAYLGGLLTGRKLIGNAPAGQGRGVARALVEAAEKEGIDAIEQLSKGPMTQAFVDFANKFRADKYQEAVNAMPRVYQRGDLVGDGAQKSVVSQLGHGKPRRWEINADGPMVAWMGDKGEDGVSLLAKISTGYRLADLTPAELRLLSDYGSAIGVDLMHLADEMVPASRAADVILTGVDEAVDASERLAAKMPEAQNAAMSPYKYLSLASEIKGDVYFIKDVPNIGLTRRLRQGLSTESTSSWMAGLRRQGFKMTNNLPSNITLTDGVEGARQLRNWAKALGATDEVANRVGDAFLAADVGARKQVILDSMQEIGENIDNPLLRFGLVEFSNKQGQYTYFYDRAGNELGQALNGTIQPMTLAHFTDSFAMPEAKSLLQAVKRYKGANGPLPHITRGVMGTSTRKARERIARNLKTRIQRTTGNPAAASLTDEDFMKMAYADVLSSSNGHGRASVLGHINAVASMAGKAYQGLHHVFVIAQLAGRPIAWTTRVLMEESFRAELFSLPTLWANPTDYMRNIWESTAIRKLPDRLKMQGEVAEGLVNSMFLTGKPDWDKIEDVIPGARRILANGGVNVENTTKVRGAIASMISKEMMGDRVTDATIGLKGNITRRAWLNHRRTRRTLDKMAGDGIDVGFNWTEDGAGIANRSFYQGFVKEAQAATVPATYELGVMTQKGLDDYGRKAGRQVFQMTRDPIVGRFGFGRAISRARGQASRYDGARLVRTREWNRIKYNVARKAEGDGLSFASDVAMADWYLDTMVDEIVETLFRPLAREGDPEDFARILSELQSGKSTTITFADGVEIPLNAKANNYEGFVDSFAELTEQAYLNNIQMPPKISAYFDPRFGQEDRGNIFRRASDWTMMAAGEIPTQALHRKPAWVSLKSNYNAYYKSLGWTEEAAAEASTAKATEMVNYIFFDNKNIPAFLKDMNDVVPFFSAMWEVASTWAYKIPSQNVLPVGYAQLARRVSRTLNGLIASGLVDYDPENGTMTLNVSSSMLNADDPVTSLAGKALYQWMRLPVSIAEWVGGIGSMFDDEPGYTPANLSAFAKDGFSISIGNPLDPTTHGIMAVNQFSVGLSPVLQWPLSMGANAVFAQSEERIDTEGTVADFLVSNPEADVGDLLRYNREAFVEANGKEAYNRALAGSLDLMTLEMPDNVRIPETSTWEMLVDRAFFPFGKIDNGMQVLTAVSPSAMNYVWRGLFQKLGVEDDSAMMGMLFGQMSNYQVSSEVLSQLQMLEAAEGALTRSLELSTEIASMIETMSVEIVKDPDGTSRVLNPDGSAGVEALQEKLDDLDALNFDIMKRANDNAAGALLMRGIMGQLGPSTPRMWNRQQEQAANYWKGRNFALEAEATGSSNYAELVKGSRIESMADMQALFGTAQAWLQDPSGDAAKVYMEQNLPGLRVFTQGKTYWGPAGPPPEAAGFDKWIDDLESGDREPFEPEVFMARYQRAGIGIDKEIALIDKYGPDPDAAAVAILEDYNTYSELTDDFDMQYEGVEFLDHFLYESRYDVWRRDNLDELSAYELLSDRVSRTQQEVQNLQDLLEYTELTPDERRRIGGALNSTIREANTAIRDLREVAEEDTWYNPREQVLNRYWEGVSNPFYEERNAIYDQLSQVTNSTQRSAVFDAVRNHSNRWLRMNHTIEGHDGAALRVPAPQIRSWNGKTQEERQELLVKISGKKPEWMDQFEMSVLINENAESAAYLPYTDERMAIYEDASREKAAIMAYQAANPDVMSTSQRDSAVRKVDDALEQWLVENGREQEVRFKKAVPIQRLDMLGMLPQSLAPVVTHVNSIVSELAGMDKSPTTNVGDNMFAELATILKSDFFPRNPQAYNDFSQLGLLMFDEALPSAVYARLLQGDYFGELYVE